MREFDVNKYLRRSRIPQLPEKKSFRHAVVIPVYNELTSFAATEHSIRTAMAQVPDDIAVIAVINYPAGEDKTESEALLNLIRAGVFPGVIPVYLPELTGGVGAARKAGMDAFIRMLNAADMEKSVIFSLDADTLISGDYFVKVLPEVLKGGAVTIGFAHRPAADAIHQAAIDCYEAYLTRYVEKLRDAGSPYAFFTVGSAFAVRCDAYVKAGGMKVREAGEDFYFLQAVAKTTGVRSMEEKLVFPSPRISTRVPFGTGPAVARLLRNEPLNEIPDGAFVILKKLLEKVTGESLFSPEKFLASLPAPAAEFLLKENFPAVWQRVLNNLPETPGARQKAFHEWFDGLKTLRFLHFLIRFIEKI
ncbi:MAG: hypothetical protein J6S43_06215 [Lentisphaeria bacterium]|nr:hypothetical protein [Lentisphaeria bacterium]